MNNFTITIQLKTYSESPEDWIAESIINQLEEDEELVSLSVQSSSYNEYNPEAVTDYGVGK
tara:strand:+ start:97 stop:279 length:183 start_codon:yes stop_codon:yes gene_type:complete